MLRRHGYGPLPVHYLGKAATFNLLYAFPLLLLGDGTGWLHTTARDHRLGVRDLGDGSVLVGRACSTSCRCAGSSIRSTATDRTRWVGWTRTVARPHAATDRDWR